MGRLTKQNLVKVPDGKENLKKVLHTHHPLKKKLFQRQRPDGSTTSETSGIHHQEKAILSYVEDENPSEEYQYTPLPSDDHFRVLELLPGTSNSIVRCRLHVEQLVQAQDQYAAISYVWGNPNDKVPIICDDRIIKVTVNLTDALRHIRDRNRSRLVWADAVCINQDDDTEKGHQVKRMGSVYENAEEVLVWLGKDSEGIAEDCFNLIRETTGYLDHQLEIYGGANKIPTITLACPISFEKSRWANFRKLVAMPWFSRLWVVQEAGLAKRCRLLWGNNHLNLAELEELCYFLNYLDLSNLVQQGDVGVVTASFDMQSTYPSVRTWMDTKPAIKKRRDSMRKMRFLDLLVSGRMLMATMAVDRVFAFLGNPSARKARDGALLIEPDYSKSIEEVYFETAFSLLTNEREAPLLLTKVDHHSKECIDGITLGGEGAFPSWVPRWDTGGRQYPIANPFRRDSAGGWEKKFDATAQIDKSLLLPAIIFDFVVWTSDVIDEKNITLDPDTWSEETKKAQEPCIESLFIRVQQAFTLHCYDRYSEPLSAMMVEEDFIATMVKNEPGSSNHQRSYKAYLQAVRQLFDTSTLQTQTNYAQEYPAGSSPFEFQDQASYAHNRRFAITKSGRFGLAPFLAEPNDVCCICPGMEVPLILRPREDGRYGLVGDSYVLGVMEGQIIQLFDRGELKLENIVLV
ncbi:HET-domain-containing protein [Hyaloscypha hepaticicola]|uniref:HET-domain-containing protein n=1 Tax=Hyaloscypha hepaticicola TaxID=2082293 RepID=A0A2J6PN47_9HELO|nr:HET-domain-containing protein [Hyaloscypha hepaticicola]